MCRAHFDLNALARVCSLTLAGRLLYQLSPVDEYECLISIFAMRADPIDELSEDDLEHI